MSTTDDPYKVLGVKSTATDKQIKAAYRKQCTACHPDKHAAKDELERNAYHQQFLRVQWAYELLSDPQERAFYDEHGFTKTQCDDTPISKIDQTIIDIFREVFDPRGQDPSRRDLVKDIRLAITDRRIKVRESLRSMQATLDRMVRLEGRFLRKGVPHNALARSIRADIEQLGRLIAAQEEESAHLLECLKEIETYTYTSDGKPDVEGIFRVRLTSEHFEQLAVGSVTFRS